MYCSHPLNSLQSGSNAMLSRRSLCLQTMKRRGLVSCNVTRPRIRKQSSGPSKILCCCSAHQTNSPQAFDTGSGDKVRLPTQGESVVRGSGGQETMLQELPKPPADIDYLAVSPHHLDQQEVCFTLRTAHNATCVHAAGTDCSTAKWAQRYWLLWDKEYGLFAPELDRSAELCNGAHGM